MTDHAFALTKDTELNHYQIESVLGQGGFGVVYKAHHTLLHETVVIKEFLPVELAGRQGQSVVPHGQSKQALYQDCLQRFLAEGRTLVKLRHPNVVRCRDLFNANGTAYLVMDFEDGLPLDLLIKSLEEQDLRYSEQQLLHFLLPLCDGLDYIHQQGVLHRDIKPANVFIRRSDGSPVIIDFGAAKQNYAAASQSQAPYTEFYAPLEQIEGSGDAKPTVDVHAFGGLMYRLLTGQVGPRAEARAMALLNNQPDPLVSASALAGEHYSATLLATVDRCLAFLPKHRPASMAEVKQLLLAEIAQPAADPEPPTGADFSALDEFLELAGADGVITPTEMQMLLHKAETLQLEPIAAQRYLVQRSVERGWQLHQPATNDFFSTIFAQHPRNPVQQTQHVMLDREKLTLCIERNSPALKSHQLAEYIGIETAGKVFTPLIHKGQNLSGAYTQVFSTAEDQQQVVEIRLLRAPEPNDSQAVSITTVTIGLAKPAPAGVPQIEIAIYAKGDDLYLDVQRLDQPASTPPPQQPSQPKHQPQPQPQPQSTSDSVSGVGGWLWLIILALIFKLTFSGIRLLILYQDYSAQGSIELAATWYETYVTSMTITAGYIVALTAVLVLLFRRSRRFVMAYTTTVIAMTLLDFGPVPLVLQQGYAAETSQLLSVLVYELVLCSYLFSSKRVKNTFIRG